MNVVFDHSHDEAANIRTFFFRPEKPLQYTAGQYVELTLKHVRPDRRGQRRWFTLSSSPTDELLSITTKNYGDEASSFKKALFAMEPGHQLTLQGPLGDFVLPKLIQTPLVFVAGGIGITPFHSILEWLHTSGEERPIQLLYGVNNEDEIIFQETFDKTKQHATIVVSEPSAAWGGERGRLSAELILGLEQPSDDSLVYLSGPEPMVQALEKDLVKAGVDKRQIVTDEFLGYSANY